MEHCVTYYKFGYTVTSHLSNYDLVSDIIPNIFDKNRKPVPVCKDGKVVVFDSDGLIEHCREYLNNNFKKAMEKDFLLIPDIGKKILKQSFGKILLTMKNWCEQNRKKEIMKGCVIYDYNLDSHLDFLKYPDNLYQYCTRTKDAYKMILIWNPVEEVILLIRIASSRTQNLEEQMKVSVHDVTKFVFIYHKFLTESGFNLINLLATNKEHENNSWMCSHYEDQIIPTKILESDTLWKDWWNNKKDKLRNTNVKFEKNASSHVNVIAHLLGFIAQEKDNCGFEGMLPFLP